MKTNFTMTKRLLFAFAALAMVVSVSSCSEDDPVVATDISGLYNFTGAVLINGNLDPDVTSTDLVIYGGSTDETTTPPYTATIPAGADGAAGTTYFVNFILAGAAPCENQDPTTWTYDISLPADGALEFICTSEGAPIIGVTASTWVLDEPNNTLTLVLISDALGEVTVVIKDLVITDTTLSGTIDQFPMFVNAQEPIGLSNLQLISFDVVLTKQ